MKWHKFPDEVPEKGIDLIIRYDDLDIQYSLGGYSGDNKWFLFEGDYDYVGVDDLNVTHYCILEKLEA